MSYCAIDLGTSNSSVVVADPARGTRLLPLEDGQSSMPTAVFFFTDELEAAQCSSLMMTPNAMRGHKPRWL